MERHLIEKIELAVGKENVLRTEEERKCYSFDARASGCVPDLVVLPTNAEAVSSVLKLANEYKFPVIPRGQGSGVTGGAIPVSGGVVMAFTRMRRIIEIDRDDLIAIVEPGVITYEFQEEVKKYGLFYPPDPASHKYSTIGGNVATCAGGPNSLKYGVTRDYILGLEVVLPTGEIINTGVRTMKGVVGYDLTRLFVGSEGTLGIFTKIILKLIPLPEAKATILAFFKEVEEAAKCVSSIIAARVVPAVVEFMDKASVICSEKANPIGVPENTGALLLIEVDGDPPSVKYQTEKIIRLIKESNASSFRVTDDPKEADHLWLARRTLSQATYNLNPVKIAEDVVVPRSKIPILIRKLEELGKRYQIPILSFGHAGDGNFHVSIMIRDDPEDYRKAEDAVKEIFKETLRLGGTLSGEHGIGVLKSEYIDMELSKEVLEKMAKIKKLFDPNNILNPGKMFPPYMAI
ncbi:MAG: FAD-binding protein [Desulfobacterota bacterium]|nr:FAD-binding protein [Thermodesulfobacteriota bacterium]MDW8002252.1 FAD-linked oxidase C-terminal domain-containing protein [Deltaproteobacteria bacterium]